MKAFAVALGIGFGALAGTGAVWAQASGAQRDLEICKMLERYATLTMSSRQNGVAMSVLIDRIRGSDVAAKILRVLVAEAYDVPLYSTGAAQERAVAEYANKAFSGCYRDLVNK